MSVNLPEPTFIETNPALIEQDWISKFEADAGKTLYPAQPERLIAETGAYRESLISSKIQEVAKSLLLAYAPYPIIDYLGELVGKTRLPEQKAKTTIRYTLEEVQVFDVLIPAGSRMNSKDGKLSFVAITGGKIAIGSLFADIEFECETAGTSGNGYISGQINIMDEPIDFVQSAQNITTSSGGTDVEDTETYRERIRLAPEENSTGGKLAYKSWVLGVHQDIIDVAVITPNEPVTLSYKISGTTHNADIDSQGNMTGSGITSGAIDRSTGEMSVVFSSSATEFSTTIPRGGKVEIYPLTLNGAPSNALKTLITNALSDDNVRPLGDLISVLDPQKVDFVLEAQISLESGANSELVLNAINGKINVYLNTLKSTFKRDVKRSEIIALIYTTAGVKNLDLISPAADILMSEIQYANCTNSTITVI